MEIEYEPFLNEMAEWFLDHLDVFYLFLKNSYEQHPNRHPNIRRYILQSMDFLDYHVTPRHFLKHMENDFQTYARYFVLDDDDERISSVSVSPTEFYDFDCIYDAFYHYFNDVSEIFSEFNLEILSYYMEDDNVHSSIYEEVNRRASEFKKHDNDNILSSDWIDNDDYLDSSNESTTLGGLNYADLILNYAKDLAADTEVRKLIAETAKNIETSSDYVNIVYLIEEHYSIYHNYRLFSYAEASEIILDDIELDTNILDIERSKQTLREHSNENSDRNYNVFYIAQEEDTQYIEYFPDGYEKFFIKNREEVGNIIYHLINTSHYFPYYFLSHILNRSPKVSHEKSRLKLYYKLIDVLTPLIMRFLNHDEEMLSSDWIDEEE
jgi:hypothetical protein